MKHWKAKSQVAQRAQQLIEVGLTKPALDALDHALRDDPDQGELLLLRSSILADQGEWADALAGAEAASLLIPLGIPGQLLLANCHSHVGNHELAVVAYENLLTNPNLPVDFYEALHEGFRRSGDTKLALAACRKAVEFDPYDDRVYLRMVNCMSELACPPKQITAVLRKVVELAPENTHYRALLAVQLALTKRRVEAYEVLAAGDADGCDQLDCGCLVRQLLELCIWAGDDQRAACFAARLALLSAAEPAVSGV